MTPARDPKQFFIINPRVAKDRQAGRQTERQAGRQTEELTDKQTDTETDR